MEYLLMILTDEKLKQGNFQLTELFAKDKKGNIRVWSIKAENFYIYVKHGLVDGLKTDNEEFIPYGAGGRTRQEQMILRINRMIMNKIDHGYSYEINTAQNNARTNSSGYPRPTLAQKFIEEKHQIVSNPTGHQLSQNDICQRKLNGYRCLTFIDLTDYKNIEIISYSRKGKIISTIKHIHDNIIANILFGESKLLSMSVYDNYKLIVIDGELYNHEATFQQISSWIKKEQEGFTSKIKYVLYDMFFLKDKTIHYFKRYELLKQFSFLENIEIIENFQIVSVENLNHLYNEFISDGYEGLIIRRLNSRYEDGMRSNNLLKLKSIIGNGKTFDNEDEFLVLDINKSKKGVPVVHCAVDGKTFRVVAPGSSFEKEMHFKNKDKLIGKHITVQFSEYTQYGIPFQPIAIKFRDMSFD